MAVLTPYYRYARKIGHDALRAAHHYKALGSFREPALAAFVGELRRGDCVFDLGANAGWYSYAAAKAVGPGGSVVSVEPQPGLLGAVKARAGVERLSQLVFVPAAVAGEEGLRQFAVPTAGGERPNHYRAAFSELLTAEPGRTTDSYTVCAVSLASLVDRFGQPDALKIDIEGAELEVLSAAAPHHLERCRVVQCEINDDPGVVGSPGAELFGYFGEHGFRPHIVDGGSDGPRLRPWTSGRAMDNNYLFRRER